ncbi:hypothetical protein L596_013284 [Steinernema carpocapsae]|uniref:Uncharacterized protein n=1 Tax=Steinernema carpocapsae TaxID=34508 RepID=A0A4U5P076_STECR|nr:hypothetical protein L596_013284 [Steinernema carpocapsae]
MKNFCSIALFLALLVCISTPTEATMSLMDLYNQMILKTSDRRLHDQPIELSKEHKRELFALFLKHQKESMRYQPEKKNKFSKPFRSAIHLMDRMPRHLFQGPF